MKWTIGRKLNGSFILVMLIAMGTIAYIAHNGLQTVANKTISVYKNDTLPLITLQEATNQINLMDVALSQMLINHGTKLDETINAFKVNQEKLFSIVNEYEQKSSIASQIETQNLLKSAGDNIYYNATKNETEALLILSKSKDKLDSSVNEFTSLIKNNNISVALTYYTNVIKPYIIQIKENLIILSNLQIDQMNISFNQDIQTVSNVFLKIAAIIIASLMIGTLIFYILIRGIVIPLQNLLHAANEISHNGDLNQSLKVIHNDEIGELTNAFQDMTNYFQDMSKISTKIANGDLTQKIQVRSEKDAFGLSFKNMILGLRKSVSKILNIADNVSSSSQQLSSSAQQINSTTQEIAATVQQIAKGSQAQAQRVEDASKIIDQMNMNVNQVANNSQTSATTSVQASTDAEKANQAVQAAMLKMNTIYETVINSAKVVKKLGDRSEQIDEIVNVITNIADQTNLLALNAAIEAARAGEAGRGFAVVAEEVRKLAEGSAKAAEEITVLIKGTQSEADEAVKAMELGSHEVQEGKEIAANAGGALQEIIQTVKKTSSAIQLIANSAQSMAMSTKEVVKSIDDIATTAEEAASGAEQTGASTEQMSASMQQIAASSQELSNMAMTLQEAVAQFKLDEFNQENEEFKNTMSRNKEILLKNKDKFNTRKGKAMKKLYS